MTGDSLQGGSWQGIQFAVISLQGRQEILKLHKMCRTTLILALVGVFHGSLFAQSTITFLLGEGAPLHADSVYFFAGNINDWKPSDLSYKFDATGKLQVKAKPGSLLEWKVTRGSWSKAECMVDGTNFGNRRLTVSGDTTLVLNMQGWTDVLTGGRKKSTASRHVIISDTAFFINTLSRSRTLRFYLPPDYHTGSKRYPVLYLHDGQNCFDDATSFGGEWHADEALDRLFDSCGKSFIVVAIDNSSTQRLTEYNPYNSQRYGKGEGMQYAKWLATTLKPYVDKHFRTMPEAKYSIVAGSSMGGLISFYLAATYPQQFGAAGVFSPAFWVAPEVFSLPAKMGTDKSPKPGFFFYAGGKESANMENDTRNMYTALKAKVPLSKSDLYIDKDAGHNEAAWAKWFPLFLKWLQVP
jgi:predicted alpha/beta superfamily hydrolase